MLNHALAVFKVDSKGRKISETSEFEAAPEFKDNVEEYAEQRNLENVKPEVHFVVKKVANFRFGCAAI